LIEHYNSGALVYPYAGILIGHTAREIESIKVAFSGVIPSNCSSYKVAEKFYMLLVVIKYRLMP
jgi:hypothetical protein